MTTSSAALVSDPMPQSARTTRWGIIFGVVGGPLAWFVQLCVGFGLASWPCFPKTERILTPDAAYAWTWPAMIGALIGAALIALAASIVSWRNFSKARRAGSADHSRLIDTRAARRSFLALAGLLLGAGFALTTILTAVGFLVLPRCAG